jgi:hypothetical protein
MQAARDGGIHMRAVAMPDPGWEETNLDSPASALQTGMPRTGPVAPPGWHPWGVSNLSTDKKTRAHAKAVLFSETTVIFSDNIFQTLTSNGNCSDKCEALATDEHLIYLTSPQLLTLVKWTPAQRSVLQWGLKS